MLSILLFIKKATRNGPVNIPTEILRHSIINSIISSFLNLYILPLLSTYSIAFINILVNNTKKIHKIMIK